MMAAYSAAKTQNDCGMEVSVTLLEKMPRPGRKIMITGKGRCNFTNVKDWQSFSAHIRTNPNFIKSAFYNMNSEAVIAFFDEYGMRSVVERGDRAFPASYHASEVVDTLVQACSSYGVKIEVEKEVCGVARGEGLFEVACTDGSRYVSKALVIATGGLSYPGTGSTGDGYSWAEGLGHSVKQCFPSLTALVPRGYKLDGWEPEMKGHIPRSAELSEMGAALCGIQLKNIAVQLFADGVKLQEEFGDIDFTDGGIEGPTGFQLSRKAVKAIVNGARNVSVSLDLKAGVPLTELTQRVKALWSEVDKDPRSAGLREKEKCRILLGKLMPWNLIPAFIMCNPGITTLERRGRSDTKLWVNLNTIASCLKDWNFSIQGYVGYERAVVTAGGVNTDEFIAKTMESRLCKGLYLCGELLDIDSDTGGYNLQTAFSTGCLAGLSAAKALSRKQ